MCLLFLYNIDRLILLFRGFGSLRFLLHSAEVFEGQKCQKQTRILIVKMHQSFFYEWINKFCEYNIDEMFKVSWEQAWAEGGMVKVLSSAVCFKWFKFLSCNNLIFLLTRLSFGDITHSKYLHHWHYAPLLVLKIKSAVL